MPNWCRLSAALLSCSSEPVSSVLAVPRSVSRRGAVLRNGVGAAGRLLQHQWLVEHHATGRHAANHSTRVVTASAAASNAALRFVAVQQHPLYESRRSLSRVITGVLLLTLAWVASVTRSCAPLTVDNWDDSDDQGSCVSECPSTFISYSYERQRPGSLRYGPDDSLTTVRDGTLCLSTVIDWASASRCQSWGPSRYSTPCSLWQPSSLTQCTGISPSACRSEIARVGAGARKYIRANATHRAIPPTVRSTIGWMFCSIFMVSWGDFIRLFYLGGNIDGVP